MHLKTSKNYFFWITAVIMGTVIYLYWYNIVTYYSNMTPAARVLMVICLIAICAILAVKIGTKTTSTDSYAKTPLSNSWMMQKARVNPNYLECLMNGICPACGNKLQSKYYGTYDQFSDHRCICGFETICEVLY